MLQWTKVQWQIFLLLALRLVINSNGNRVLGLSPVYTPAHLRFNPQNEPILDQSSLSAGLLILYNVSTQFDLTGVGTNFFAPSIPGSLTV